jgi:hypothetical protein
MSGSPRRCSMRRKPKNCSADRFTKKASNRSGWRSKINPDIECGLRRSASTATISPPLEVAYLFHSSFSTATNDRMDRYFHRHSFSNPINPGQVRSGFVFSNLEMGTKAFNVDVIGEDHQVRTFTFLIPVEGIRVDHREVACHALYAAGDRIMLDSLADLKNALEALPCCTTGEDGMRPADPVNVVIVGDGSDVLYALLRSGWDETAAAASYDPLAQLPWELRYQPVKPLYFLKRPRDAAFRKSRTTLNERNQPRHRRALYRADDRNP